VKLVMVSPESLREFTIEWMQCMTLDGARTILPGHAPFMELLVPQENLAMQLPGGAIKSIAIENGIISVDRTSITIVLEHG
jgi:F0F1-type ATP synthase epsilon subunit